MTNLPVPATLAALANADTLTDGTPYVWTLTTGERYEGGRIVGIYTDEMLARRDFLLTVQDHMRFGSTVSDARRTSDGGAYAMVGIDWTSLSARKINTTSVYGD